MMNFQFSPRLAKVVEPFELLAAVSLLSHIRVVVVVLLGHPPQRPLSLILSGAVTQVLQLLEQLIRALLLLPHVGTSMELEQQLTLIPTPIPIPTPLLVWEWTWTVELILICCQRHQQLEPRGSDLEEHLMITGVFIFTV